MLLAVPILIAWILSRPDPADGSVLVLMSQERDYYQACLEGLEETVADRQAEGALSTLVLPEGKDEPEFGKRVDERGPRVLVTLGTRATRWAVDHGRGLAVCFAMVPSQDALGLDKDGSRWPQNVTGVVLEVAPERQVDVLRRVLPDLGRIGILHSDASDPDVSRIQALLDRQGLRCVLSRISSAKDLASGLSSLAGAVDLLLALPDPLVYNGVSARYVLLFSLQNRIPLVAFSANYVKGGALMGLYADPGDIGAQCGTVVKRILEGKPPSSIPVELPVKIRLGWNRKVAERLGFALPAEAALPAYVRLETH